MPWLLFRKGISNPEQALAGLDFDHAICEGATKTDLLPYAPGKLEWNEYDKGLLFGSESELRFRRRADGGFHLALVTDLNPAPPGWQGLQLRTLRRRSRIVLWGEPDAAAGGWFEGRIPVQLPYRFPVARPGRVVINRRHYEREPAAAVGGNRPMEEREEIRRCVAMQFVAI
jgi:hypothetical protein